MPRGRGWTTGERRVLRDVYPNGTREAILAALPGRTWDAITAFASTQCVHRQRLPTKRRRRAIAPLVQQLIERRLALRLRQMDVALKAGVSTSTLASIEAGSADPRLTSLRAIAVALGAEIVMLEFGA